MQSVCKECCKVVASATAGGLLSECCLELHSRDGETGCKWRLNECLFPPPPITLAKQPGCCRTECAFRGSCGLPAGIGVVLMGMLKSDDCAESDQCA